MTDADVAALEAANRALAAQVVQLEHEIADLKTQIQLMKDREKKRDG